jgi:hypothetical protein
MRTQHKATVLVIWAILAVFTTKAQQDTTKLKKEVEVVKAYQPTIQEFQKINDIPQLKPEQTEPPTFDYSIFSKPVYTTFDPTPVAAAKMVGEPRPELGNGLLKLGLGNYQTPYGELFFNARSDKKSNFGLHFNHLSSSGKIRLLNDDLVKAPESLNSGEVFVERFMRKSTLTARLGFDRQAFSYYGYASDLLTDEQKEQMIPWFGQKQYFAKGTASIRLKSEMPLSSGMNYDFKAQYHYFTSKTGQTEHEFIVSGNVSKKFDKMLGILDASLTANKSDSIWSRLTNTYGETSQQVLRANPSVKWQADVASLQIGVNATAVLESKTDAKFYLSPRVNAQWSPVPEILTLFVAVDGYVKQNTYSAIAAENPYVDPYHDLANTNYQYVLSGGFKGKFTSKTNYVASATYSVVKDQYFYYLVSQNLSLSGVSQTLNNTFSYLYDDVNILKLSGEVLHSVSDEFSIHLLGNYYSYKLKAIEKPWQMPNFEATLSGIYKPNEKFKFTADIFLVGKRTALISDYSSTFSLEPPVAKEISMDPILDFNFGAEYYFLKNLNFFCKLNNLGFQKYEQWLGYTHKNFNWLAGISYRF